MKALVLILSLSLLLLSFAPAVQAEEDNWARFDLESWPTTVSWGEHSSEDNGTENNDTGNNNTSGDGGVEDAAFMDYFLVTLILVLGVGDLLWLAWFFKGRKAAAKADKKRKEKGESSGMMGNS
jgi:hypothetical protein